MKLPQTSGTTRHWDAGDAGCGRLIMGLKHEVDHLRAGETLSVIARDPAAHMDLDYWCHLTGHALVSANHPNYVLRKKG